MTSLEKTVKRSQRRLWLNRWLGTLGWCLTLACVLFAIAVLIQRLWLWYDPPERYYASVAAGLAVGMLVGSLIWALLTRDSMAYSAARLDESAGLKERLSSGLHCRGIRDPFAQAVVADAENASRKVTVPNHLPVRAPMSANYAGITLVVSLLIFWLFPVVDLSGEQEAEKKQRERTTRVERTKAIVKPMVDERLKKLQEKYPNLKDELEGLDAMKEARLETPLDVRVDAMKKIEKIRAMLDQKKSETEKAAIADFKRMLRPLATRKSDSSVGRLAESLSKGDFKAAQAAISELKLKLSKTPKTEEEKQQAEDLKKELDKLSQKLNQLATEQKLAQKDLAKAGLNKEDIKRALEHLQKKDFEALKKQMQNKGLSDKQIQKIMQQMKRQCKANQMAKKLAQNLGQPAGQGQPSQGSDEMSGQGAQGLSGAGDQLSELEALQQEMNQLNSSMAEWEQLQKDLGMGCQACQGTGMKDGKPCGACQGSGFKGGMGPLGQGQGGIAPEQKTDTKTVMRRSGVHTLPGRIISQRWVDGEQVKGEVTDDFVEAALSAEREVNDAVARERIPRTYHKAIKGYFTRSREMLPAEKVEAAERKLDAESP